MLWLASGGGWANSDEAAGEFRSTKEPWRGVWSPTRWADVWATYTLFDGSYTDRRTFGFNANIANGFVTPVPTLILNAA